ncbi:ABC transporter permease [bacterium]|nr:ABC transporter permease [bacterium]
MRNIFVIARWEYITRIRSKWFIISTLIIPIVLVGFMFLSALVMESSGSEMKLIALIDETHELSDRFEQIIYERYLLKNGQPKYQVIVLRDHTVEKSIETASDLLDSMIIDAYVYIPADIMKENNVKYYSRYLSNYRDQSEVHSVLNSILLERRFEDAGLDAQLVKQLTRRVNFEMVEVGRTGEKKQKSEIISYIIPIIFVLMLYFAIVMSSQVLLRSVLEERTNRLVEILLSSVSSTELMSGKILGLGLLGLTQLLFYMICGSLISTFKGFDILTSYHILYFLMYFVLGYMFFSGIFSAFGAIFTSEQDAQQAVSIISIISVLPLLMSSYVIANPTATVTIILSHIPFITPFFMILLIGMDIPPTWHIISTTLVLIVSAVLSMLAAGKIFRTAILMYGKRPTLPEIIQWVKSS